MGRIFNTGGFLPEKMHCLMMRGKLKDYTKEDAFALAEENGIRKAESIIKKVAAVISDFRKYAEECEVNPKWIGTIEACLKNNLKEWGLSEERDALSLKVNNIVFNDIRMERARKGNFHLL